MAQSTLGLPTCDQLTLGLLYYARLSVCLPTMAQLIQRVLNYA